MSFNPKDHIIKLKGKDYLEVKWRLVWMRDTSPLPDGVHRIETDLVSYDNGTAIVKAFFFVDDMLISTGYGTATNWKDRTIEKAETAAIGRALAIAGFGTQFDNEFEDSDHLADAPNKPQSKPAPKQTKASTKPAQNGTQGEKEPYTTWYLDETTFNKLCGWLEAKELTVFYAEMLTGKLPTFQDKIEFHDAINAKLENLNNPIKSAISMYFNTVMEDGLKSNFNHLKHFEAWITKHWDDVGLSVSTDLSKFEAVVYHYFKDNQEAK